MSNSDDNVVHLSPFRALDAVARRDFKTKKFFFAYYHKDGTLTTYIPEGEMSDMELCYIADTVNYRRRLIEEE